MCENHSVGPHRAPVLIVEDNFDLAEALARIVGALGYDATTAGDGLDALSYLRGGGCPSLIVLDLKMPNMDGEAFVRALKADPRWEGIPVVVFSAFASQHQDLDVAAVVRKTDPDMLLSTIERLVPAS
jgi:CheY-like chemotaxis protein